MYIQDKIKLAIYESCLDDSDKVELLDIVESADDIDTLESVVELLESTRMSREEAKRNGMYRNELNRLQKRDEVVRNELINMNKLSKEKKAPDYIRDRAKARIAPTLDELAKNSRTENSLKGMIEDDSLTMGRKASKYMSQAEKYRGAISHIAKKKKMKEFEDAVSRGSSAKDRITRTYGVSSPSSNREAGTFSYS